MEGDNTVVEVGRQFATKCVGIVGSVDERLLKWPAYWGGSLPPQCYHLLPYDSNNPAKLFAVADLSAPMCVLMG